MFPKSALGSLGYVFMLIAACGGGSEGGGAGTGDVTAGGASGSGGATGSGGTSVAPTSGADGSGPASGAGGTTGSDGASGAGGLAGMDDGSASDTVIDAAMSDTALKDAASERMTPSQCIGANQACGEDGGTCCEAYVCRLGKCCVPTGIRSNCIANSDCCSNTCVQRQCTCAPLGYSCTGPGQCCAGFACENGTCICPPDIRGCN